MTILFRWICYIWVYFILGMFSTRRSPALWIVMLFSVQYVDIINAVLQLIHDLFWYQNVVSFSWKSFLFRSYENICTTVGKLHLLYCQNPPPDVSPFAFFLGHNFFSPILLKYCDNLCTLIEGLMWHFLSSVLEKWNWKVWHMLR